MKKLFLTMGLLLVSFGAACAACVAIYGDSRTNHEIHRQIVEAIIKTEPEAVFHVGDLVANGEDPKEWARFNEIAAPLTARAKLFPLLGNHDLGGTNFEDNFELPGNERWYCIERIGVLFVLLDDNSTLQPGSPQYRWLENVLREQGGRAAFRVVMFHRPIFTTGKPMEDEAGIKDALMPLFARYGVSLVVNGHVHAYERLRVKGIDFVITGGGGAPLYQQVRTRPESRVYLPVHHFCQLCATARQLTVKAIGIDGKVIDQFTVSRK